MNMKRKRISFFFLLFVLSVIAQTAFVLAAPRTIEQEVADNQLVEEFLESTKEMEYKAQLRFTGKFHPIPNDLKSDLQQAFPSYRFLIAKVQETFHPPNYDEWHLILVTDSASSKVISFIWAEYWMLPASSTFKKILKGHKAESNQNAVDKVKLLASLITYPTNCKVGHAAMENGKVKIELLSNKDDQLIVTLEAKINKKLQFDTLTNKRANGGRFW
jgi:hypothetical protein